MRLSRLQMGETFKVEDQRFRTAGKQVAECRDAHVLADTIASLGGTRDAVDAGRVTLTDTAMDESLTLVSLGRDAIHTWPIDIGGFHDIAPGFGHTYRKCLQAWDLVHREPNDENYHRLRRLTKYHWFHVRALGRLKERQLGRRGEHLYEVQTSLGKAHDLAILQDYLKSQRDPDEHLLQKAAERKLDLYQNARKVGRQVFATTADELIADLSRS